jgi:hypothetical protein
MNPAVKCRQLSADLSFPSRMSGFVTRQPCADHAQTRMSTPNASCSDTASRLILEMPRLLRRPELISMGVLTHYRPFH